MKKKAAEGKCDRQKSLTGSQLVPLLICNMFVDWEGGTVITVNIYMYLPQYVPKTVSGALHDKNLLIISTTIWSWILLLPLFYRWWNFTHICIASKWWRQDSNPDRLAPKLCCNLPHNSDELPGQGVLVLADFPCQQLSLIFCSVCTSEWIIIISLAKGSP